MVGAGCRASGTAEIFVIAPKMVTLLHEMSHELDYNPQDHISSFPELLKITTVDMFKC